MLYPSPISLFCTLLLCFHLALIYTVTGPLTNPSSSTAADVVSNPAEPDDLTQIHQNQETIPRIIPTSKARSILVQRKIIARPLDFGSASPPAPAVTAAQPLLSTIEENDADDELLLRRASFAKRKSSTPKKVAFMFLTTTPLPTAPLWELFFRGVPAEKFNIYVHADPSFTYSPPFEGVFAGRVIPSKPTRRHSPTLAAAARRLLAHALLHDRGNTIFALLSAACIPLHSFNFTHSALIHSRRSFIEILKNETNSYERWAARGEEAMLPEVELEDFRIGSQFFALTRRHARLVVKDRRLWRKFALPCNVTWSCYPEEHYFPTLLSMADPGGCVHATLTHVDWWGRTDGHPHTYNESEVSPELITRLRSERPRYGDEKNGTDAINGSDPWVERRRSGRNHRFLFARKFGEDTIQPLMSIVSNVILED